MGAREAHVGSPGGVEQNEEVEEEARRSHHRRSTMDQSWRKERAMNRGELGRPRMNKGRREKEENGEET